MGPLHPGKTGNQADKSPGSLALSARLRAVVPSQQYARMYVTSAQWKCWQGRNVYVGQEISNLTANRAAIEQGLRRGEVYLITGKARKLQAFHHKARTLARLRGGQWSPPTIETLDDKVETESLLRKLLGGYYERKETGLR